MAVMSLPPAGDDRAYLRKRLPGTGSIVRRRDGFMWQVMRKGVWYRGPMVATWAIAEADLDAAVEALDRGGQPAVAPPGDGTTPHRVVTLAQLREELRAEGLVVYPSHIKRPRERADCLPCPACQEWRDNGASSEAGRLACGHEAAEAVAHSRPCLFVACTATNYVDENRETGAVKFNHPHLEPGDLTRYSCSLDMADEGPVTLDAAGAAGGVTRERTRQIEVRALAKVKAADKNNALGLPSDPEVYAGARGPHPGSQ